MTQENQQEVSPEVLENARKKMVDFYKRELPLMRLRAEYEELATKIDKARFDRMVTQIQTAQLLDSQNQFEQDEFEQEEEQVEPEVPQEEEEEFKKPRKLRSLKKETV